MTQQLTVVPQGGAVTEYSDDQIALIKQQCIRGGTPTDDELAFFLATCRYTKLDPFRRQVWGIMRWDGSVKRKVLTIQTSIDGYRAIAQRSGRYQGQSGPQWCSEDGQWRDIWLSKTPPAAARVGVWCKGFREPTWGIAVYSEYVQAENGQPTGRWKDMPAHMLAKCAEANALRKCFVDSIPEVLSTEESPATIDLSTGEVIEVAAGLDSTAAPAHPSRYQPPRPDVMPSYDQNGNQKTGERGELLWCAGPVECYLSQSPDKSRSFLKSTGRCPLPEHNAVMFADLTGPIRWGHAVRGADTCWLDEAQQRAAAREAEAKAALDEQLPFTDAEEATAVADPAPFAHSGSV